MIAGLPYDAEVEYLELTNVQYIDTGVTISEKTEFEFWFSAIGYSGTYFPLFGVYGNESGSSLGVQRDSGGDLGYRITVWRGSNSKRHIGSLDSNAYKGVVSLHSGTFSFRGQTLTISSGTFQSSETAWYGRINGVTNYFGSDKKLGFLKIWEDGVLVRDFIPVRVGSGSSAVGCMYDRVSRKLFRNAGTGAFTIGPDVATPVMGLHFFKSQIKTAKDYVQNGLIAMWDGIENAGWGVHDAAATTWKDLSPNGNNLTLLNEARFDGNSLITANSGKLTGTTGTSLPWATIEACAFFDSSRNSSVFIAAGNSADSGRILCASSDTIQPYTGNYQISFTQSVSPKSTWAATYSGNDKISYVNGSVAVGTTTTNGWSGLPGRFCLSGRTGNANWNFVGNYYCVRLYSRALTAEEIAWNQEIDKARFNLP